MCETERSNGFGDDPITNMTTPHDSAVSFHVNGEDREWSNRRESISTKSIIFVSDIVDYYVDLNSSTDRPKRKQKVTSIVAKSKTIVLRSLPRMKFPWIFTNPKTDGAASELLIKGSEQRGSFCDINNMMLPLQTVCSTRTSENSTSNLLPSPPASLRSLSSSDDSSTSAEEPVYQPSKRVRFAESAQEFFPKPEWATVDLKSLWWSKRDRSRASAMAWEECKVLLGTTQYREAFVAVLQHCRYVSTSAAEDPPTDSENIQTVLPILLDPSARGLERACIQRLRQEVMGQQRPQSVSDLACTSVLRLQQRLRPLNLSQDEMARMLASQYQPFGQPTALWCRFIAATPHEEVFPCLI